MEPGDGGERERELKEMDRIWKTYSRVSSPATEGTATNR